MRAALCLSLALALAACSQSRYRLGEPLPRVEFRRGAELSEVLAALGPPQRLGATDFGYVMAWEHWRIDDDNLGISLSPLGIDLLGIDLGAARVRGGHLLLGFDRSRRLLEAEYLEFDRAASRGQGIQMQFSAIDVADVDDLTGPLPQHRWGMSSLRELPVALNRGSDPDGGQRGLERRGTPSGAGQRAAEMR